MQTQITNELYTLANEIANGFPNLPVGLYPGCMHSVYKISIVQNIQEPKEGGKEGEKVIVLTPARVAQANENYIIELNKDIILGTEGMGNPDYVFYLIIWCIYRAGADNVKKADSEAMTKYLMLGKGAMNMVAGNAACFQLTPSIENKERFEQMEALLSRMPHKQ